jgi:thiamine biosynthesis protein ThiS
LKLPPSATKIALMAAISIMVNGERRDLNSELDLAGLLSHFSLPEKRVAIELNGRVVSRADWPQTIVGEGDRIEVVHFVGGG